MKKILALSLLLICLSLVTNLFAVTVNENDQYVIVETDIYELHWNKAAQMGYMEAFVGESSNSIITPNGRALYHSSNYAGGWKDWGALEDWEILEEGEGKVVVQYQSHDGGSKQYTCVVTYWDAVEYIEHKLTITNTGADVINSFESGHEPQFETNGAIDGMESWEEPIPHAAYWVNGGFAAIYGPDAQVTVEAWGGREPGRMSLNHDSISKELQQDESHTVTYYVAFGEGEAEAASALASTVTQEPTAVDASDKLSTTWGKIKKM